VAGIPEIIDDGDDGLIVPSDDVSATVDAVNALLESPDRWRAMSLAGPRKLADRFDRTQTIEQLVDVMAQRTVTV
jgi:glycosyltransferase involved in cell wall biosynthesis